MGYKMMADAYRKMISKGLIKEEDAKANIKALEFLEECTTEDRYALIDSTAFNIIIETFCLRAMCDANMDAVTSMNVINTLRDILSNCSCEEIMKR